MAMLIDVHPNILRVEHFGNVTLTKNKIGVPLTLNYENI